MASIFLLGFSTWIETTPHYQPISPGLCTAYRNDEFALSTNSSLSFTKKFLKNGYKKYSVFETLILTGLAGFEPANTGVKVLGLTTWR